MSENGEKQASSFALTVRRAANLSADKWTDERIAVVKRTVAPDDAGPAEVAMFLAVASRYDLDPFAKEIWLAKDKGRLIILTGKDSILKVARSNPGYLGHESGVVYSKDTFKAVHKDGNVTVLHQIDGFDRGEIVGAYCLARKEGHPPVLVLRKWSDYSHLHHKDNWKNYPEDMLLSRVLTAAHRMLYNISGMYTPEEVDSGEAHETLASHEVAAKTKGRLDDLRERVQERFKAGVTEEKPEPESEVVDAEFEVVEEPVLRNQAGEEVGPDEEVAGPAPEKTEAEKSDYERARGRYWALYKESYDTDDNAQEEARRQWLESHFGKRSFGQLSTDEIRTAIELLERGEGPAKPQEVAATSDDMPF